MEQQPIIAPSKERMRASQQLESVDTSFHLMSSQILQNEFKVDLDEDEDEGME